MEKYTAETITWIKPWTDHLFSFRLTRSSSFRFTAGQFARLGVKKFSQKYPDGKIVWRAYSIVSAPYDEFLEFYSIVVPDGEFTTELYRLKEGDTVYVEKMNYGFLTLDRFEGGKDLWLLSTGTGLAPFISVLYELKTWEQFENIILVHSVRDTAELAYQETVESFKNHEYFGEFAHRLKYVRAVTRCSDALKHDSLVLTKRITTLLETGELENLCGIDINADRSRVMICGNPDMVEQTREILTNRGLAVSRRGIPGQLAVENYW